MLSSLRTLRDGVVKTTKSPLLQVDVTGILLIVLQNDYKL